MATSSDFWRPIGVAAALALTVGVAACSNPGSKDSGDESRLTVFAAASLTEAFTALGETYERQFEDTEVEFSFGASSDLAGQVDQGAPADVFASADEPNMEKVTDEGMNLGQPQIFAGNVLEIAVPKGNPAEVEGLEDLADPDLKVAVCDTEVPCGNAARQVFANAGVKPSVDSYEPDVKSVLTKVELGEVDAGLVYHSDVLAAGEEIDSIEIPGRFEVVNHYPIVVVEGAEDPKAAQDFIDLVLSPKGQNEMKRWGFQAP